MSLFYEEATCKISTIKGLLYAPENPEERKKGMLIDWPWLLCATSMALLIHWQQQLLKDMMSLGTDFETHAIWQGYVEDPAAKDFIARKACTIALSKMQGTWQSTLFMSLEIPWGFHTRAVLHSLAEPISREKVSVRQFLWVRKVWFAFTQWTFAPETFGESQKGEKSPVVSLLSGSHERLASRNPRVLCKKYGGARTTYLLVVPRVQENGTRNWIPVQPRKAWSN